MVGNGDRPAKGLNKVPFSLAKSPQNGSVDREGGRLSKGLPNPFGCVKIMFQKEDALILWSNALFYMNYSVLQAALAPLVMNVYGLDSLQAGLCFLAYGLATMCSSYLVGEYSNCS